METKKLQKVAQNFYCESCDYNTCRVSSMTKHKMTSKHLQVTQGDAKSCNILFQCEKCLKNYASRNGLWKHKKSCIIENNEEKMSETPNFEKLMMTLLNQNLELQKQVIDLCKDKGTTINNTINNTTNNSFNLNFFLNEKCKHALNIMDFVDTLQLQLQDLENTGQLGYITGITKIFIRGLKELDVDKRPIHCSDLKREILYVKDKDIWEKENSSKKIKKAIGFIAQKNIKQISNWKKENPDYYDSDNKKNDQYMKILFEAMGGRDEVEQEKNENKIIKNVAREVLIDKL